MNFGVNHLKQTLRQNGFPNHIKSIVVAGFDKCYPTKSLLEAIAKNNDAKVPADNSVEVQNNCIDLYLVFDKENDCYIPVEQDEIENNLYNGIIQIAYDKHNDILFLGIPRDTYAFNHLGTGFAFEKPYKVSPVLAMDTLKALLDYNKQVQSFDTSKVLFDYDEPVQNLFLMMSMNSAVYDSNVAFQEMPLQNLPEELKPEGSDCSGSDYHYAEIIDKFDGAKSIEYALGNNGTRHTKIINFFVPE